MLMTILQFDGWLSDGVGSLEPDDFIRFLTGAVLHFGDDPTLIQKRDVHAVTAFESFGCATTSG
jgi:hypothetical protein